MHFNRNYFFSIAYLFGGGGVEKGGELNFFFEHVGKTCSCHVLHPTVRMTSLSRTKFGFKTRTQRDLATLTSFPALSAC